MINRVVLLTALLLTVLLTAAFPLLYVHQTNAYGGYRSPYCERYAGNEEVGGSSEAGEAERPHQKGGQATGGPRPKESADPGPGVNCEANAIARANLAGGQVTMVATTVTLSLGVIAAIVSALQLGGLGVQRRSRTGPVIDLVVERGSFIWSVHNPGTSKVTLKTVVASLAPPGTPHRSLLPVGAATDDIAIRPGRTRCFTRAVPAGPGSLFLVSRFELADGSGGSAWASFTMSVAPGSYDKNEEGVAYY